MATPISNTRHKPNTKNERSRNRTTDATPTPSPATAKLQKQRLNPTSASFSPTPNQAAAARTFDLSTAFNNLYLHPVLGIRPFPSRNQPQIQTSSHHQPSKPALILGQGGSAGTSSRWTSPATRTNHEYARIQTNAKHLGLTKSPFWPRNVGEFNRHRAEWGAEMLRVERRALEVRVKERERRVSGGNGACAGGEVGVGVLMGGRGDIGGAGEEKDGDRVEEEEDDGEGGKSKPSSRRPLVGGRSKVLGLRTDVWAGDEEKLTEGQRKHNWDRMRASWPDAGEYRLEGEGRLGIGLVRRLPRPRVEVRNVRSLEVMLGDLSELTYEEAEQRVREVAKWRMEELAVWEKMTVEYKAELDFLASIEQERELDEDLEGGLTTSVLTQHGSLASYIAAKGKVGQFAKGTKKSREKTIDPLPQLKGGFVAFDGTYAFPPGTLDEDEDEYLPGEVSGGTPSLDSIHPSRALTVVPQQYLASRLGLGAGADSRSRKPQTIDMESPPGGWKFEECHLRVMQWGDLLDEIDGKN